MAAEHWEPLPLNELIAILRPASFHWWLAGGYAIEHFVGRPFRSHADIDILLLRRDATVLHGFLPHWELWTASSGTLRPWHWGEQLPPDVHDIWCRRSGERAWRFQVMLDCSDGDLWRSRRCASLRMPIDALGVLSREGSPFLRAEIQLFYKAKSPRLKDEQDFEVCLPLLDADQKAWLHAAISTAYGSESPWLQRLT
jgi:hypothetical protein